MRATRVAALLLIVSTGALFGGNPPAAESQDSQAAALPTLSAEFPAARVVQTEQWPRVAEDQTAATVSAQLNDCFQTGCPGYARCTIENPPDCDDYWDPHSGCDWAQWLGACLCSNC